MPVEKSLSETSPTADSSVSTSIPSPSAARDQYELSQLRRRVAELEAELHEVKPSPAPSSIASVSVDGRPRRPLVPDVSASSGTTSLSSSSAVAGAPGPPVVLANEGSKRQRGRDSPPDTVVEDAASILEFLAWGRRKNPDYQSVAAPGPGGAVTGLAQAGFGFGGGGGGGGVGGGSSGGLGSVRDLPIQPRGGAAEPHGLDDLSQTSVLQLLLPDRRQTLNLVIWHQDYLLWYHCSYYAPSFRRQLDNFYDKYGGLIDHPEVNLQWVAFLFSVLTGAITCMSRRQAQSWGFSEGERERLSKSWFRAVIACLNKADYTANHSILAVHAIATLTISAHTLGFSNLQSIHLAAAVKIGQSLGLHRLTADVPGSDVEKEAGRRVWAQLCCQDWFSLPFSETYLINPLYSKSDPPINRDDEDEDDDDGNAMPRPDSVPTVTGFARFHTKVAAIMPRLQDGLMACNTPFTKYQELVKWDKQMKTLTTTGKPYYLDDVPIEPGWPEYIPWARRAAAISSSHKIIMVHRSFLSESFTNPAFAFTRQTCLAASKTIITEYHFVSEEEGPVLWIHQAFSVAAAIILMLDVMHREEGDPEIAEHVVLVEDALRTLRTCRNSMIAVRGVRLLGALLEEIPASRSKARRRDTTTAAAAATAVADDVSASRPKLHSRLRKFNVPAFVRDFCEDAEADADGDVDGGGALLMRAPPPPQPTMPYFQSGLPQSVMQPQPVCYEPPDMGLEGMTFENLLYLSQTDFYAPL